MVTRRIAFFDFDGTITTKDTLLEFIKFAKGNFRFYTGFLLYSPYMVAFKLKLISNHKAKQAVLAHFFNKTPASVFREQCNNFATQALPGLIRSKALAEIKMLQEKGVEVVIVSASPENWIEDWANSMKAGLIATILQVKNERLSGVITGRNCHGEEKVCRIKEKYQLSDYNEVYAYGDTSGDLPMLKLANFSFYKPFR